LAATEIIEEKRLENILLKIKNIVDCRWPVSRGQDMAFAAIIRSNETFKANQMMAL